MESQQLEVASIAFSTTGIKYRKNPAHSYQQDIIAGVYEGGFKVWECTIDLLKYMEANPNIFANKSILEIGCGHGIVGIAALKLGATFCCFHDYNEDVIESVTKTNILLNDIDDQKCRFAFGDWSALQFP